MRQQEKSLKCIKSILHRVGGSPTTTTTTFTIQKRYFLFNTISLKERNSSSHKKNNHHNTHGSSNSSNSILHQNDDQSISNIINNNFNINSIPRNTNKPSFSSPASSYIDPHNTFDDDQYIPSSSYTSSIPNTTTSSMKNNYSSPSSLSNNKAYSMTNNTTTTTNNNTTTNTNNTTSTMGGNNKAKKNDNFKAATTITAANIGNKKPNNNDDDDEEYKNNQEDYTSYEQVLKKRNEIMDTLEFYRRMKKEGSTLDNRLYHDGKQQSPLFEVYREVKFFLKANEKGTQLRVVETLLDKLVETIKEIGDVETARTLLNLLKKRIDNCNEMGLSSENIVLQLKLKPKITKLLQMIINTGDVTGAINFLRNAKNEHGQTAPYIGTSAFTVVLNGLIKEIKVFNPTCEHNLVVMKRAMELFNWMDESDQVLVPPDEFTFTTLIRGYALINDMSMAMELFNQMSTEYGMKPPTITKATIIEGYIKEGNIEKAFQFFKDYCNEDFDGYYNSLITGFTHEGNLSKAFELVDEMKLKNISITTNTYNSFLLGLFRSKNYTQHDVDTILKTMSNSNLKPNSKTYSLIIRCLIQQGKLNESIQYYAQHPDAILGAKTIAATLLKSGRLEEAEHLMNQMLDSYRKYGIDNSTMASVLQYLIKVMLSVGAVKKASVWRKQVSRIYNKN